METEKLLLLHPQSRRIGRLDEKLRKSGIDIIEIFLGELSSANFTRQKKI